MAEFVLGVLVLGAGVFCASGLAKLRGRRAYREYRTGLGATRLVPARLLNATALALVAAEAITAGALATAAFLLAAGYRGGYPLAGLALALAVALTLVLTAGVAVSIRRGSRAPCVCFGGGGGRARPLGAADLIRDIALAAMLGAGLAGLGAGVATGGSAGPAGSVLAIAAGLVATLLVVRWDDVMFLYRPAG